MTARVTSLSSPAVTLQHDYQAQLADKLSIGSEGSRMKKGMEAGPRKSKVIMLRVTDEEYLAIRDEAFRKGGDMAPLLRGLLQPHIDAMKAARRDLN